jgi:hypothetical protein
VEVVPGLHLRDPPARTSIQEHRLILFPVTAFSSARNLVMLRKVNVIHEEARPASVTLEVDVRDTFTLEELQANFNRRARDKMDPLNPTEPHSFTDDQRHFLQTWNAAVGWDGFYRLPQKMMWQEDAEARNKLVHELAQGDAKVATALMRADDTLAGLDSLDEAQAQRAMNILQGRVKGKGKDAKRVLGDFDADKQTAAQKAAAKPVSQEQSARERAAAERVGNRAAAGERRGDAATGGTAGEGATSPGGKPKKSSGSKKRK